MRIPFKAIALAALCCAFSAFATAVVKEPEVRLEKIEFGKKLLAKKVVLPEPELIAQIGDPFGVAIEKEEEVVEEVIVDTNLPPHELIPLLARNVNPTGIFAIGGEYYLMFKEEKVKAGGVIPVVYQNKEYNLEIVSVLRNAFNLRLEDAELEVKLKN